RSLEPDVGHGRAVRAGHAARHARGTARAGGRRRRLRAPYVRHRCHARRVRARREALPLAASHRARRARRQAAALSVAVGDGVQRDRVPADLDPRRRSDPAARRRALRRAARARRRTAVPVSAGRGRSRGRRRGSARAGAFRGEGRGVEIGRRSDRVARARRSAAGVDADRRPARAPRAAPRHRTLDGRGDRLTRLRASRRVPDERLRRDRVAAHPLRRRGDRGRAGHRSPRAPARDALLPLAARPARKEWRGQARLAVVPTRRHTAIGGVRHLRARVARPLVSGTSLPAMSSQSRTPRVRAADGSPVLGLVSPPAPARSAPDQPRSSAPLPRTSPRSIRRARFERWLAENEGYALRFAAAAPGTGKTTAAVEYARANAGRVWYVSVAAAAPPAALFRRLAANAGAADAATYDDVLDLMRRHAEALEIVVDDVDQASADV